MGHMTETKYAEAVERFAEATERLLCEEFQRGTDSLGPDGWGLLAGDLRRIGYELTGDGSIEPYDDAEPLTCHGLGNALRRGLDRAAERCDGMQETFGPAETGPRMSEAEYAAEVGF